MDGMENAGDCRHFSLAGGFASPGRAMRDSRRALLVLLASALVVVGCTTWIEQRVAPGGDESVSQPLPAPQPPTSSAPPPATALLKMPIAGVDPFEIRDSFLDRRGARPHHAVCIMALRGTPVLAVADGVVAKAYRHPLGGLSVYQY